MNLIVLSHIFPRKSAPTYGTFVEEQVQALKKKVRGEITVISPIPWSPRFLWFRKKWREYGQVEKESVRMGINVRYKRYVLIPGKFFLPIEGFLMYLSVRSLIKTLIKANKSRIILHAHTVLPDGLAAIFLKKKFGIKIVCTAHGSDINLYPFRTKFIYVMTKYVLRRADALVGVSEKLQEKIRDISQRDDVKVVTNGVNPEKITGNNIRLNTRNLKNDTLSILFVGKLCFEKGIKELLNTFKLLSKEHKHLHLIMVGKNTIPKWIESFIKENQMYDSITLTGPVDHEDLKKYYSSASIFVLPSHIEGMPTVMFEAMANRLPIIISRVGGVEEVIKEGINGLLVEPRSEEELHRKLNLVIKEKSLRDAIGMKAYDEVLSKYTWDHNADKMSFIYKDVLQIN
ncbi:MAG: glycosyltransferase [Candidatus Scalindua sp.]|nr:glycosyltransferase [Candidatus Scalindua sp.]